MSKADIYILFSFSLKLNSVGRDSLGAFRSNQMMHYYYYYYYAIVYLKKPAFQTLVGGFPIQYFRW